MPMNKTYFLSRQQKMHVYKQHVVIQDVSRLQVWSLWKTTIWFSTQMSWVSSCSVMARSFPCHNKVSGPRQHFLKTETLQQLQWIMCFEHWDSSAHHLSRVSQTRTTQARVSWMLPIYSILPPFTDWFPFFPCLMAFCIVLGLLRASWVALSVRRAWNTIPPWTRDRSHRRFTSAVVLGENATFTLWKLQRNVFP